MRLESARSAFRCSWVGRAYAIVDDRTISFSATASYDDQLGTDDATALFKVKVDPWMFRAHVGIRFHYLGNQD